MSDYMVEDIEEVVEQDGIDLDYDTDAYAAFAEVEGLEAEDIEEWMEDMHDRYEGHFANDAEFAESMADAIGAVDDNAAWPLNYIDWERAAQDLMYDYYEENGYYFRAY
jgi:hypothetical protein